MLPRMLTLATVLTGLALPVLAQTTTPAAPPATAATPATPAAPAAQPRQASPAQQAQQQRMRDCNAQAGTRNLAGDARRAFMQGCLSGQTAAPATAAPAAAATPAQRQQQRMRDCNTQAGTQNLAGDARRSFMQSCLAGAAATAPAAGAATPATPRATTPPTPAPPANPPATTTPRN